MGDKERPRTQSGIFRSRALDSYIQLTPKESLVLKVLVKVMSWRADAENKLGLVPESTVEGSDVEKRGVDGSTLGDVWSSVDMKRLCDKG